jgi:tRNA(adenine34) deaminase
LFAKRWFILPPQSMNSPLTDIPLSDEYFMRAALKEAQRAFDEDEIPVGAVVVVNNSIIARGYNQTEKLNDPTAHAEMIALTSAFNFFGAKYLPEATLYVTLEPCLMCSGATYWAQVSRIVWGADDDKNGFHRYTENPFHPKAIVTKGIMKNECTQLLKDFFRQKR